MPLPGRPKKLTRNSRASFAS
jgi:hypothetical protein